MKMEEVSNLIGVFSKEGLNYLRFSLGDFELELKKDEILTGKNSITSPEQKKLENLGKLDETDGTYKLEAPMVGIYYSSPSKDARPFVGLGDRVEKGQVVAIIEAMKMINEISSPVSGRISSLNFKDEDMVEYGDVLMEIEEDV